MICFTFRRAVHRLVIPALAAAVLTASGCRRYAPPHTMGAPEVVVVGVTQEDVPIYGEWLGTLDGYVNAEIQPQVSGYLMKQNYAEGSLVHKGDLLFEIDPRTFQAVHDQSHGQLAQAQAQFDKTALDVKRYTPLAKTQAISQEELDDAVQANLQAKAAVDMAQATVRQTELNLEFTRITSPIDGIAGIAQGQIGDLVSPSGSILTTVSTLDPIKAYFPISEQEYMKAAERIHAAEQKGETNRTHVAVELVLANGATYAHTGAIILADRQVDIKTGTIRLAAAFPNSENILRPGQFARIRMVVKVYPGALLVPQRAVSEVQGTYHVAVVDAANKVSMRTVEAGERVGQSWIIHKGLAAGERVIVEGLQKVRDGMEVTPKPMPAPTGAPAVTAGPGPKTLPYCSATRRPDGRARFQTGLTRLTGSTEEKAEGS